MLITNDEVVQLKPWLVKELESISEADSQILSDYVVALLQAEGSEAELHANTVENLTDFLGDNTRRFVEQVFSAVKSKKYLPGKTAPVSSKQEDEPSAREPTSFGISVGGSESRVISKNRKRNYDDFRKSYVDWDAPHTPSGRGKRQAVGLSRQRRDIQQGRGHYRNSSNTNIREGMRDTSSSISHVRGRKNGALNRPPGDPDSRNRVDGHDLGAPVLKPFLGMPDLTSQTFDPSEALRALMTLQAMGFPLPFPGDMANGATVASQTASRSQKPCRDYEKNGVCLRGLTCRFQHRGHKVQGHADNSRPMHSPSTQDRSSGSSATMPGSRSGREQASTGGRMSTFTGSQDTNGDRASSMIAVTNIPENHLDEDSVRDFFSSFGSIMTVRIAVDDSSAIVEFDEQASAEAAIQSPQSVFDNRFVQVSGYVPDGDETVIRTTLQDHDGTDRGLAFDQEFFEAHTAEAQKKYEARKALLEQTQLKKRELAAKEQEIETLKALELQKMRDILQTKGQSLPLELQQILDTNKGERNTEQLLAQLKALEDEAKSLGLDHNSWYHHSSNGHHFSQIHRGRGSYRGRRGYLTRGRGQAWTRGVVPGHGAYNLDNRPKQIRLQIVGLDATQDEHLKQFLTALPGFKSLNTEHEADIDSQVITFSDRRSAEAFFYSSNDIPGAGLLTRSWVTAQSTLPVASMDSVEMVPTTGSAGQEQQPTSSPEILVDSAGQREQRDDAEYGSEEYEWIV